MLLPGEMPHGTDYMLSVVANTAAISLLSVGVAFAGASIPNTAPHSPAASPRIEKLAPDAARIAIATGMSCELVSAGPTDGNYSMQSGGSRTLVNTTIRYSQTPASIAARVQYDRLNTVEWREQDVKTIPYGDDGLVKRHGAEKGPLIHVGGEMDMNVAGESEEGDVDVVVPTDVLEAGAVIVVQNMQDVETGTGGPTQDLRETVSGRVCGAFRMDDGRIVIIKPPANQNFTHTFLGAQANDFSKW